VIADFLDKIFGMKEERICTFFKGLKAFESICEIKLPSCKEELIVESRNIVFNGCLIIFIDVLALSPLFSPTLSYSILALCIWL
jgi:hypothetical protein